jgi:hypothetical protein
MDAKEIGKIKMHLQAAMDCIERYEGTDSGDSEGADDAGDDDPGMDMGDKGGAMTGLKMSLSKYK